MTKNQKKDFFLTIFNAIIGLIVMYFSKIFLNDLEMLLLSSGAIVLVILPVQVRKKKQRKLIAAYLNNIDTTLQENIYKVTRITTAQLKNYTVLGNGIASSKLYKIEEILSKMQPPYVFNQLIQKWKDILNENDNFKEVKYFLLKKY